MQTIKIKLSKPSKMPGFSFALPAQECKIGGKLRNVPGSVCSKCYACKGAYVWPVVKKVRYDNLEQITSIHWVNAMIDEITKKTKKIPFFRWHDGGDLQSSEHFQKIVNIAKALPNVKFWLPTKEKKIVKQYKGAIPENLAVRLSAAMIDGKAPAFSNTSTVHTEKAHGFECPAPQNEGKCNDCRACWDKTVKNVSYKQH